MKRLILFLAIASISIVACDKVSNPIVVKNTVVGSKFVVNNNDGVAGFRKVLLEDYTGQTCPNCPTAADLITNSLVPTYNETLIVVAVHQGNTYAKPTLTFTNDFRTTAGEEWGKSSGFGIGFYPCGLINRSDYGTGRQIANQAWPSIIPKAQNDPFVLQLNVRTSYDTTVRSLSVKVKGTWKKAYTGATKVLVLFTEDGIVGKQKKGSVDIEEYEFEHMLRGSLNGDWGASFSSSAAAVGDSIIYNLNDIGIPDNFKGVSGAGNSAVNDKNVSIVVFVYDEQTKVVLQAEKLRLRPAKTTGS